MRPIEVLFVDKGGVLIDNSDLSPQWRRLIGEFLAPRLGGSAEAWGTVASADAHAELVTFLEQIGARDLFDRVYGSDLVNTWKFGPEYYRAVLADSGVDPRLAAVVDDSRSAVSWARECGMRGFLVERRDGEDFDTAVTRTLADVAAQAVTSGSDLAS